MSLRYDECPYLWSQRMDIFRTLFLRAAFSTLIGGWIGDSTFTVGNGNGDFYIGNLNYRLNQLFASGNNPGTAWTCNAGNNTTWLLNNAALSNRTATNLGATRIPYGLAPGNWIIDSVDHQGMQAVLLPGAANAALTQTAADTSLAGGTYYNLPANMTAGHTELLVLAYTRTSSGEIVVSWAANATGDQAGNALTGTTTTNTALTLGLELAGSDTTPSFLTGTVTLAYTLSAKPYMQADVMGSDAVKKTGLVASRFRNPTRPEGIVVQPLATGGKKAQDFAADWALTGPLLLKLGLDFVVHGLGINDIIGSRTAAQFKTDVLANLALLRATFGATFPVILAVPRYYQNIEGSAEYTAYAGVLYEICQGDPYTMLWNRRRYLEDAGINSSTWATYLSGVDGIHDIVAGGRLTGLVDAKALFSLVKDALVPTLNPATNLATDYTGIQIQWANRSYQSNGAAWVLL